MCHNLLHYSSPNGYLVVSTFCYYKQWCLQKMSWYTYNCLHLCVCICKTNLSSWHCWARGFCAFKFWIDFYLNLYRFGIALQKVCPNWQFPTVDEIDHFPTSSLTEGLIGPFDIWWGVCESLCHRQVMICLYLQGKNCVFSLYPSTGLKYWMKEHKTAFWQACREGTEG